MGFKIPESARGVVNWAAVLVLGRPAPGREGLGQAVPGPGAPDDADFAATARRELREETGLAAGTLTDWGRVNRYEIWPAWRHRYAPGVTHNTEHVFGFRVDAATAATLDPSEHVAQLWLSWQEAMAKVFSATNRAAIGELPRRVGAL